MARSELHPLAFVYPVALAAGVAGALSVAGADTAAGFGWLGGWYAVPIAAVLQWRVWRRLEPRLRGAGGWSAAGLQVGCAALTLLGWLAVWHRARLLDGYGALIALLVGAVSTGPLAAAVTYGGLAAGISRVKPRARGG
jgi:hypothetical protein